MNNGGPREEPRSSLTFRETHFVFYVERKTRCGQHKDWKQLASIYA